MFEIEAYFRSACSWTKNIVEFLVCESTAKWLSSIFEGDWKFEKKLRLIYT